MKRVLFALACFLIIAGVSSSKIIEIPEAGARMNLMIMGSEAPAAAGGGYSCSGDFSSGAMESFEASEGSFCTSDWTESDGSGVVSTYDTAEPFCESHNLKISADSSDGGDDIIYADMGSEVDGYYIRFVIMNLPDVSGDDYYFFHMQNGTTPNATSNLSLRLTAGEYLRLKSGSINSGNNFELTAGNDYLIEVNFDNSGGTHSLRVWGTPAGGWDVVNHDGAGSTATVSDNTYDFRYILFSNFLASSSATLYIDDVQLSTSDWLGALTCP